MLDNKLLETTALEVAMVSGHIWRLVINGMAITADTFLPSLNMMARLKKIDQWD